ncbi:MAG TPA: ABC transporter substrate-binding protein [Actinocrinis sp.]|uniref:ABC transporter substrate-binding protein n=1 Tax=Actinocrinis sp. TaxID=1920516 RepID=UPI002DDD28C5|nr:ABC transporter substrate-binding protein [Actinocrinis sp.]HEV2344472.1 ABC transporter substrate-binding protein [Actinocrinis sp.]
MRDRFPSEDYGRHLVEEVRARRMTRRDLIRRAGALGLGVPVVGLLLEACGDDPHATPAAAQKPRRGGTLWVAAVTPTSAIDPVTMDDAGSISIVQRIAQYLIWVNQDYTLRPVLATSWRPNADASRWTFQIRQGVKFSDGTALTADDVVASIERVLGAASRTGDPGGLKSVLPAGGAVKSGTYEVTFHLARPFVDFPYAVASTTPNAVILPRNYAGDFVTKPVGTGPFLLTSYKDGAAASLVRNPRYWQTGLPYLDRVEINFNAAVSGTMVAVEGGAADLVCATPAVGSPVYSESDVRFLSVASTYYDQLFFRTDQKPFDDRRVRQAIAYALQRDQIIKELFDGRARPGGDHVFAPGLPHSPTLPQRSYDPARARALLADAGLPNGFTVTLTTQQSGWAPSYARLAQSALREIGVTVRLQTESDSAFRAAGPNAPWLTVPMGIAGWSGRATAQQYYSASFVTGAAGNSAHWSNPDFDALALQYDSTIDEQSRADTARRLAALQQQETPAVIAYWVGSTVVARKTVNGVTASGANSVDLTSAWLA